MKNLPSLRLLPLASVALCAAALALSACSKQDTDQATAKAKEVYQDSKDAAVDAWNDVKSYTFEKHDDFTAEAKARMAKIEAQESDLRANYSDAQATASRKAAMDELKNSDKDYKAKVDALGTATADTWESAKQNVVSSWDHLKAAYDKARAD
jgi:hypothetical protein